MSTRTSIFREVQPGVYYGVYRHHDGYPEGAGYDLYQAIQNESVSKHMQELFERYDQEYENFTFEDIMHLWQNSDHEYGYIVYLDGRAEVYDIYFGPGLENNTVKYAGELSYILDNLIND